MGKYRIMLVDDEEEVRSAILKKLDWDSLGFSEVCDAENRRGCVWRSSPPTAPPHK